MMPKTIFSIAIIFICLLLFQIGHQWPDENLHIIFCDVGQGDAILLTQGFWQMLIDAGPDDKVMTCLKQHLPFWDRHLEVMLETHPDKDHIGGFPDVINNYEPDQFYLANLGDTKTFKKVISSLKQYQSQGLEMKTGFRGSNLIFSPGGIISFLAPSESYSLSKSQQKNLTETLLSDENWLIALAQQSSEGDVNAESIVLLLTYGNFELLLMGDASIDTELALINDGLITEVESLKVGHHGANTSTSTQFIRISQPEFSVLSCGVNNQYGHPSATVLQVLKMEHSQVLRTDQLDTIELITNGNYYWFEY